IIELKQWTAASMRPDGFNIAIGNQLHTHPSDQALGYKEYLENMSASFADKQCRLASCAFLHNALSNTLNHVCTGQFKRLIENSPIFGGDQLDQLARFIEATIESGPDSLYLSDMDIGNTNISKTLFANVATAIRHEPTWQLLNEQRAVFN